MIIISPVSYGQVFNAGTGLQGNTVSLGFQPTYYGGGFKMFVHGDIKITSVSELNLKHGFNGQKYYGAAYRWKVSKRIAINTGAHFYGDIGLDGTVLIFIPISNTHLISGIDADLEFTDELNVPVWVPVGMETAASDAISFMLEGSIPLANAPYIFGGGIIIYL